MKKRSLLNLAFLSLLAFGMVQCKNLEQEKAESNPQGKMTVIVASLEQPVSTKTALTSERKVVWSAGDQIRVYNNSNPDGVIFSLEASSAGTSQGKFSGETLSGSGPFYAVYPASAGGKLSSGSIALTLPSRQAYAEGSFGSGAAVSMAKAQSLNAFSFKNVLGGISFAVSGDKAFSGVRLQTRGQEALSGNGKVQMNEDTPVLTMDPRGSGDDGYLYLEGIGGSVKSANFCLMLPPGAFDQGFLVEFLDKEGNVMFKTAKADVNTVLRSSILDMPETAYAPMYKAAFFQSDGFGYFPSVGATKALDALALDGQYSFRNEDDTRRVRVMSLAKGYCADVTTPTSLPLGSSVSVSVSTVVGSTKDSFTKTYTVLQKEGKRVWLVNPEDQDGIIQKMEE